MVHVSIGVIGLGFVGGSMYRSFREKDCHVRGYDINKEVDTFAETIKSQILFLCLPTVYNEEEKSYDKSCIRQVCHDLSNNNYQGIVIIKSTVEPTATAMLAEQFPGLRFVHNPEFLTAATAFEDFHNQKHIVLGRSPSATHDDIRLLEGFYKKLYPEAEISVCSSTESESMKIFCNSFYAVKVQMFNEFYALCEKLGNDCDYETVKTLMLKNGWINPMHTTVPGPDGMISYGGYCFPKDTNALLQFMETQNSPREVLEATIRERNLMRDDHTNVRLSSSKEE